MRRRSGAISPLVALLFAGAAQASDGEPARQPAWRFADAPAWQDEFDYAGKPDRTKWDYDTGGDGWGNHELQYYGKRKANAYVEDGVLNIIARKQRRKGRDFTSARLVSKGKGDFLYGRFEARAKLPPGVGTWPAIWLLPTDWAYGGWPRSGEIDMMEHVGYDPGRVHVSVHTQAYNHIAGTQKTSVTPVPDATSEFHRYRIDWTPDAVRGYIDDAPVFEFRNESGGADAWPFDRRFHWLLNVAVGGDWGGKQGVDAAAFPATMQVDYVRVYPLLGD